MFARHQDMAYWPDTPDTHTATVWLAIEDSTLESGCMRFVPATIRRTRFGRTSRCWRSWHLACPRDRATWASGRSRADSPRRLHGAQRPRGARLGRKSDRWLPEGLHRRLPITGDDRDRPRFGFHPQSQTTTAFVSWTRSASRAKHVDRPSGFSAEVGGLGSHFVAVAEGPGQGSNPVVRSIESQARSLSGGGSSSWDARVRAVELGGGAVNKCSFSTANRENCAGITGVRPRHLDRVPRLRHDDPRPGPLVVCRARKVVS